MTQITLTNRQGNTSVHVDGEHKAIADTFEDAAYKDYRVMSGCFYVVLRVLEQENEEMFRMLKVAHAGIHPSRLIKETKKETPSAQGVLSSPELSKLI